MNWETLGNRAGRVVRLAARPMREFVGWCSRLTDSERIQALILVVTTIYVIVAGLQWTTMQHAFRISERARVIVNRARKPPDLAPGTLITFTVYAQNVGRMTATHAWTRTNYEIGTKADPSRYPLPDAQPRNVQIEPGEKNAWRLTIDVPAEPLDPETVADIDDSDKWLRIYGVLHYWDGFEDQCTFFCFQFLGPVSDPRLIHCERPMSDDPCSS